jgi:hypothetical protein
MRKFLSMVGRRPEYKGINWKGCRAVEERC